MTNQSFPHEVGRFLTRSLKAKTFGTVWEKKNGCSFRMYVLLGDKVGMYVHTTHFILNKLSDF